MNSAAAAVADEGDDDVFAAAADSPPMMFSLCYKHKHVSTYDGQSHYKIIPI